MLFSALFSPQKIKSKIRFLAGQGRDPASPKGIRIRVGRRAAEGSLAPTPPAGRFAACLPLAAKCRKIDGLLIIRRPLPLAESQGDIAQALPGEILYWTEKQVIIINTRRSSHPLDAEGRFVSLGRLEGHWRSALARTPSGSQLVIQTE